MARRGRRGGERERVNGCWSPHTTPQLLPGRPSFLLREHRFHSPPPIHTPSFTMVGYISHVHTQLQILLLRPALVGERQCWANVPREQGSTPLNMQHGLECRENPVCPTRWEGSRGKQACLTWSYYRLSSLVRVCLRVPCLWGWYTVKSAVQCLSWRRSVSAGRMHSPFHWA